MKKRNSKYRMRKKKKKTATHNSGILPKVSLAVETCCKDDEVDRISELPDDILVSILSFLTFREATATKILSSRWGRLDPTPKVVALDFPFPLEQIRSRYGGYVQLAQENTISDHISRVNCALDSYEGGPSIDKFKIDIPLGMGAHSKKWLEFALSKETEIIDIRMIDRKNATHSSSFDEILHIQNDLRGFKYLKELSLLGVRLDNYGNLLTKFVVLERLSIDSPQTWRINIRFCGIHRGSVCKLKYLNISNFSRFCDIKVCDMMELVSLRCHGKTLSALHLENVPKLVDLTIVNATPHMFGGILPRMVYDVVYPQLLRFQLYVCLLDHATDNLRNYMHPRFRKVRHMVLEIEMDEECSFHHLFPVIRTCPIMEELEIKFLWSSKLTHKQRGLDKYLIERKAEIYKLKTLRLSGYLGSESEFEFVLFIVNNAKNLKDLIIVETPQKNHVSRPEFITDAFEHLRSVIPTTVNFISL